MADGVYEVWLSSEDTGAYGLDVRGVDGVRGVGVRNGVGVRGVGVRNGDDVRDVVDGVRGAVDGVRGGVGVRGVGVRNGDDVRGAVDDVRDAVDGVRDAVDGVRGVANNKSGNNTDAESINPTHPLNITHLLKSVSALMDGHGGDGAMVRLGMTNPPYILQHLDDIASFLRQPNVFSFLHIPVQSGSNRVLKAMQREYTVEDFCTVVDTLQVALLSALNRRKQFPASQSQRTLSWASDRSRRKTMPRRWLCYRSTTSPS